MVALVNNTYKFETNGNLGAVEIMTFISLTLLGISLSQGYTYFQRNQDDKPSLKLLVLLLLILELFHSLTISSAIYIETVTRPGLELPNSYPASLCIVAEMMITFIVQSFFSQRIYRLSGKPLISIVCFTLASFRVITGFAISAESFLDVPKRPNGVFVYTFSWLITTCMSLGIVTDVLIAGSMIYYLRKFKSPSNLTSTAALLNRLVRWSLQTGLVTSLTSAAVIIFFQAVPNLIYFGLYLVLAKLYSISLLVSLNARPRKKVVVEDLNKSNFESSLVFGRRSAPMSIFGIIPKEHGSSSSRHS